MRFSLSFILFLLASIQGTAHAYLNDDEPRRYYLQMEYSNIHETNSSDTSLANITITSVGSVELGVRLKNIFSIGLIGLQSLDHTLSGYGFGLRVDVPGFFLLNSHDADFTRRSKKYPVNTSFYGFAVPTSYFDPATSVTAKGLAMKVGFEIDIFLMNRFTYLCLDGAGFTYLGRSHTSGGVGLGVQF